MKYYDSLVVLREPKYKEKLTDLTLKSVATEIPNHPQSSRETKENRILGEK